MADGSLTFIHFQGVEEATASRSVGKAVQARAQARNPLKPLTTAITPGIPREHHSFIAWLLVAGGVSADSYRAVPLHRRIPALLRLLRVKSPDEARALLEDKPELVPAALSTILIGVSSFFRDPLIFEYLRTSALPELLKSRSGLNVLSAGVSEGHELYSVAMLLNEAGALQASTLLGIDCRSDAIERARGGSFSNGELSAIEDSLRTRYFRADGDSSHAVDWLRSSLQWQRADIATFSPLKADLILYRNVAIYLESQCASLVWEKLFSALTPGGFLVTGKAECPPSTLPLERVHKSVYRKKEIDA